MRNWLWLFVILIFFEFLSFYYFSIGFLIHKATIETISPQIQSFIPNKKLINNQNWFNPQIKKAILIVIDALRFDFAYNNQSQSYSQNYQNNFPILKQLLEIEPNNTIMMQTYSDPPTITSQRIKSLAVGNLPSFIEIKSAFEFQPVLDDNIISQLKNANKKLIFIGDYTWNELFHKYFYQSFEYYSFDNTDLHSLDNHCIQYMSEFLSNSNQDWDFMIVHFVGVDHAGHTFGNPNHIEIAKKLTQMNQIIQNTTKQIANDTLLIVIGDHGMSQQGNHGGASYEETSTIIFGYYKNGFNQYRKEFPGVMKFSNNFTNQISQMDLTATLSSLFSVPIPYSNLGMVLHDFQTFKENQTKDEFIQQLLQNSLLNLKQIQQYLIQLQNMTQEIDSKIFENLMTCVKEILLKNEQKEDSKIQQIEDIQRIIKEIQDICRKYWNSYDLTKIKYSLLSYFLIILIIIFLFLPIILQKSLKKCYKFSFDNILMLLIIIFQGYQLNALGHSRVQDRKIMELFFILQFLYLFYEILIKKQFSLFYCSKYALIIALLRISICFNETPNIYIKIYGYENNKLIQFLCSLFNNFFTKQIVSPIVTFIIHLILIRKFSMYMIQSQKYKIQHQIYYSLYVLQYILVWVYQLLFAQLDAKINRQLVINVIIPQIIYFLSILQATLSLTMVVPRRYKIIKIFYFISPFINVLFLLQGEKSFIIYLLIIGIYVLFMEINQDLEISSKNSQFLVLSYMSYYFWYIYGHQAQINSIQVQSAFVGFNQFNIIGKGLCYLNEMSSFIIFQFLILPGVIHYNEIKEIFLQKQIQYKEINQIISNNQVISKKNEGKNFKGIIIFQLFFFFTMFFTTINCYYNLNSPLIIKDFAPKYAFDSCIFISTSLYSIFLYVFYYFSQ